VRNSVSPCMPPANGYAVEALSLRNDSVTNLRGGYTVNEKGEDWSVEPKARIVPV